MILEGEIAKNILFRLTTFVFFLFFVLWLPFLSAAEGQNDILLTKISKDITSQPNKVERFVVKAEDGGGKPVVGLEIKFSLIANSLTKSVDPDIVLTDEKGLAKYEVWGLQEGRYFIVAESRGQKVTFTHDVRVASFMFLNNAWQEILVLAVLAILLYLVAIKIKPGSYVIDQATGRGIKGAFVEIYDDLGRIVVNTVTSSSGKFFSKLDKGEHLLKISKNGYKFLKIIGHSECGDMQSQIKFFIQTNPNLKIVMGRDH